MKSEFHHPLNQMPLSQHNIIVPIKDTEEYFIVNPLHKSADVISANEVKMLKNKLDPNGEFTQRGYLVDEAKEKRAFKLAYLDFTEKREDDETQLFFVPNYSCNFACSYCYQDGYNPVPKVVPTELLCLYCIYKTELPTTQIRHRIWWRTFVAGDISVT